MRYQVFLNNVIILTGASSGIGRNVALQLAEQGACLALAARNFEKLEEVAEQCRERGGKVLVVPTDVGEQSQCQNLVQCTAAEFGRIDTLINNAGMGIGARFDEIHDPAILEKVMQVNFFGSVYCTHYALPYLKETEGRLVGISSLAGRFPTPMAAGYAASRHAMAAETCARLIVRAAAKRKREVVMTLQGKIGLWQRLIAPESVDQAARKGMQ